MTAVSTTEARRNLFQLVQQVNDDKIAIEIVGRNGNNAVLVSAAEWASIQETAFLLRSPVNAARLRESIEQARSGRHRERSLDRDE
ncbi:MAG: type II toxin-antitoxin system Phd/YefM family antitoxin [Sporichthyaceae bacterium]